MLECSGRLDELLGASKTNAEHAGHVKNLVGLVSVENREQASGVQEIVRVIPTIQQATQRVAASAEESAAASKQISGEAVSLEQIAAGLDAMVTGAGER